MSYKNDSDLVVLDRYDSTNSDIKALLYETYDRIRDLAVSGPSIGGSGTGKFSSFLINMARTFGSSAFQPVLGNESINIPGTSYYAPITGGTGVTSGGQAAFGLAPFAQTKGFVSGGAAPVASSLDTVGIGSQAAQDQGLLGIGELPTVSFPGGVIAGGASPVNGIGTAADAAGAVIGTTAGAGFGRSIVMPLAGLMSGVGGLLTTLGPYFGPYGLAGAAAGSVLNGLSGAVLGSFQHVSNQVLTNADTIMQAKVRNLEATSKMLDAQIEVVKKLLQSSLDGDKKLLDNLQ